MPDRAETTHSRAGSAHEGNGGYPLRDEAAQPWPPPVGPVENEIYAEPPAPARRRRGLLPRSNPWPWLLGVLVLLGGLGVAYAVTRPAGSTRAGGPPPAHASPPAATKAPPPTTTATHAAPQPTTPAPAAGVAVPSVVGSSLSRAVSALRQAGLTAAFTRVVSTAPQGRVLSQEPAGGARLPKGGRVRLGVSFQQQVAVPDVTGIQGIVAVHTLQQDHLVASLRYVPSTQPARRVVSQWPPAGRHVRPGTSVRLNLSQGLRPSADKVTVPDVTGEDEATATSDLQAAGFKVDSVDSSTTDPGQDGLVVDQSPNGGSRAARGSTVTIHVGRYDGG